MITNRDLGDENDAPARFAAAVARLDRDLFAAQGRSLSHLDEVTDIPEEFFANARDILSSEDTAALIERYGDLV